jgi:hypothetical protein
MVLPIYPHPFFVGDKKISQFIAKYLARENSPRKSARRGAIATLQRDEWNRTSDEPSP